MLRSKNLPVVLVATKRETKSSASPRELTKLEDFVGRAAFFRRRRARAGPSSGAREQLLFSEDEEEAVSGSGRSRGELGRLPEPEPRRMMISRVLNAKCAQCVVFIREGACAPV